MIPVILPENNAGTHQSSPCGREGGREGGGGDNGDPVALSRREDVLNRAALFTARPGREQHGEEGMGLGGGGLWGKTEGDKAQNHPP